MTIDALSAIVPAVSGGAPAAVPVQAGYGLSLTDVSNFNQALAGVANRLEAQPAAASQGMQNLLKPLEAVNEEAAQLSADAQAAQAGSKQMTPGEVIALTVRSTEFMFHCQLTANIANRTSDGLQQLFRQQS
ncbi:MAG: hypothetical protein GY948_01590 [Alphaproteobacteria bacterium]|nr:hypothetical protein [Alphaproteobacteria bacterium]